MPSLTLPALILTCSLSSYTGVNDTLYRIILSHSRGQLLYIQNPSTGLTYTPVTTQRATQITTTLLKAHHDVRVGMAALNPKALTMWRLPTKAAFDACTHIKLTSVMLERAMRKHRVLRANNATRLRAALGYYYDPKAPKALTTEDWAYGILAMPKVSVKTDFKKPRPGNLYVVQQTMQVFGKSVAAPKKWTIIKPTRSNNKPSKTKTSKQGTALPAKDLAPYQKGGPLPPVTDRRL